MAKEENTDINSILAKQPVAAQQKITVVGAVRAGKNKNNLELALDDTGRWVAIPLALIGEVEEIGSLDVNCISYPAVDMDILRPEGGDPWYDLLAFMMQRMEHLKVPGRECGCGGHGAKGSDDGPAPKRANRRPTKTTIANCVVCWALTGGHAGFCYYYGHCDN